MRSSRPYRGGFLTVPTTTGTCVHLAPNLLSLLQPPSSHGVQGKHHAALMNPGSRTSVVKVWISTPRLAGVEHSLLLTRSDPPPPFTGGFFRCAQYTCTVELTSTSEILRKLQPDIRRIMKDQDLNMFRELDQVEQYTFRLWTRDHYEPFTPVSDLWHPVVRDECRIINEEAQTTLEEYTSEL